MDTFIEILRIIYHGVSYENVIKDAMRFASSGSSDSEDNADRRDDDDETMRMTKFVALIEMVYMKEKPPYPIAIALLYILEDLRISFLMDEKGRDYIQAGTAQEQIDKVMSSESSRRKDALLSKQKRAMTSLQNAHNKQFLSFQQGK